MMIARRVLSVRASRSTISHRAPIKPESQLEREQKNTLFAPVYFNQPQFTQIFPGNNILLINEADEGTRTETKAPL